tara:strand:+ start:5279 stop:5878 length:600 start_codon:yes stop_codon:yes gene_type:complete
MIKDKYIKINSSVPTQGANLGKSGQTTSNLAGDDGDTMRGKGSTFLDLGFNNGFGNTNRFTDDLGTQVYASGVLVDHFTRDTNNTVLCYYITLGSTISMINLLASAPYTVAGLSGWYPANVKEVSNLFNHEIALLDWLNYAPLNYDLATKGPLWVNTKGRNLSTDSLVFSNGGLRSSTNSQLFNYYLVRYYTLAELSIT